MSHGADVGCLRQKDQPVNMSSLGAEAERERTGLVRRHAELGGFPANKISVVTTLIDPATAE